MKKVLLVISAILSLAMGSTGNAKSCEGLPSYEVVKKALLEARQADNGGLALDMWITLVDRSGTVCVVSFSGEKVDSQWPGSRVISAQKANTANAFSLAGLALSTANLYSAVQPGGSLFGLQESNPVNIQVAYKGAFAKYGSAHDPLVGEKIGGVNVFGGGLALYNSKGEIIGGLGVSGDTSCADHNIAWRARHALGLDFVPNGVSASKNDQIIFDITNSKSAGGFGHPTCGGKENEIAKNLPMTATVKK